MRVKNIVEEIDERNRINKLKKKKRYEEGEKDRKKIIKWWKADRDQSYETINDRKSDSEGRDNSGVKKVRQIDVYKIEWGDRVTEMPVTSLDI